MHTALRFRREQMWRVRWPAMLVVAVIVCLLALLPDAAKLENQEAKIAELQKTAGANRQLQTENDRLQKLRVALVGAKHRREELRGQLSGDVSDEIRLQLSQADVDVASLKVEMEQHEAKIAELQKVIPPSATGDYFSRLQTEEDQLHKLRLSLQVAEQKRDELNRYVAEIAATQPPPTHPGIQKHPFYLPSWPCRENVIQASRDQASSSRKCRDLLPVAGE